MAFEEHHPAWLEEAAARLAPRKTRSVPSGGRRADGPLRMSEVISERELRRLEYYNDFLRPAHIRDRLRVWLWRSAEAAACVTLIRSDARFSDRDKAVMAVLHSPLAAMRERSIDAGDRPDEAGLTIREAQVVALVATGRSNAEIARLLSWLPLPSQDPRTRVSQASCHRQVGGRRCASHAPG